MKIFVLFFTITWLGIISCGNPKVEESNTKVFEINYMEYGKEISSVAQAELMNNVKGALSKGGPSYAIEYCNIHATPISDSVAHQFDVAISRLSLKNRNPENAPTNVGEKILLNDYLESLNGGGGIRDTTINMDGKINYYRPIIISMETCLKCHGQPGTDIDTETMIALNELYPDDKATNYRMGEFRGVWKISFSPKNE